MRRSITLALTGLLTGVLVSTSTPNAAAEVDHQPVILPNCAVTLVPNGGDADSAECLQPARDTMASNRGSGHHHCGHHHHGRCDDYVPYVVVAEHGPWGRGLNAKAGTSTLSNPGCTTSRRNSTTRRARGPPTGSAATSTSTL